jgi:two-component system nitrate/nitrite sensor histidine kinase NarX
MSDPGISALDRHPVIWLAAPFSDTVAAVPAGIVTVALAPQELWRSVEQFHVGQHGYAMLLDQYGIRLAHGRDRRYIFRSLAPLAPETWALLQAEDRFGAMPQIIDTQSQTLMDYIRADAPPQLLIDQPDPQHGRVYYSAARMHERNWTVVAMVAEAEVLAPASNATERGLMATLIVVLLLGITVGWTAQRIVRPVPRLAQAAAKIAQGDLATPIAVQGSSELRALAENFETMRQRLKRSGDELASWASTLERRVALRSQELAALSEVVAFASRSESRSELLRIALHQALSVMGAEMGGIWIADATDTLRLAANDGFSRELDAQLTTFAPAEGVLGQVQQQGAPMALADISQAPRLARAVVKEQDLHAFAAVPLRIHGRNLGVMAIFSHSRQPFTPEAVGLATSIAQQIALTLDNLMLLEQVQEQARDVARLQERERIAGEIHDSIAQILGYLYLQTDRLVGELASSRPDELRERLGQMQEILAGLSADVRQFIARLQTVEPPPCRLSDCLRAAIGQLNAELTLQVEVDLAPADDLMMPPDVSAELARIVGEALRNAERHGRAARARLAFERQDGLACLCISDNGVGFAAEEPTEDGRSHFGLSVMRVRAARIGGELSIASTIGAGTQVQVHWPVGVQFAETRDE